MNAPRVCEACGGPTIPLLTSFVCKNECDLKTKAGVRVDRAHKMALGDGWLLWMADEKPPFGWTHARVLEKTPLGKQAAVVRTRPEAEKLASSMHPFWIAVVDGRRTGVVDLYQGKSWSFVELAYKVPPMTFLISKRNFGKQVP